MTDSITPEANDARVFLQIRQTARYMDLLEARRRWRQHGMNWATFHQESERLAAQAQGLLGAEPEKARLLYAQAAKAEAAALLDVDISKARTLGITAVSAVALWFKARDFEAAQRLALRILGEADLPAFAREQLQALLQSIWSEEVGCNIDNPDAEY